MRTEEEVREMLARCTEEFERAVAEVGVEEQITVTDLDGLAYQVSIHRIASAAAIGRHVLLWVLGETEIPPHL